MVTRIIKRNKNRITKIAQDVSGLTGAQTTPSDYFRLRRSTLMASLVLLILLVAAASVYLAVRFIGTAAPPSPSFVDTAKLKVMDIEEVVVASGPIEGTVVSKVMPGEYSVTEVLVSELDEVAAGQVIARLDTSELEEKHSKAKVALEVSEYRYEAAKMLFEEGAISQKEYLEAESAYKSDVISLNATDDTEAGIIRSPISGVVLKVNKNPEASTGSGGEEPLFVIEDLSTLKMTVYVSEYEISKVKEGQAVTVTANVLGETKVYGRVNRIATTGEKRNPESDEIVVPVYIDITDDNRMIAGITGKAEILIQRTGEVLTAPRDSIFNDPVTGTPSIYKLERDNTIILMHIRPGLQGQLYTELHDPVGLVEGDRVVMKPGENLRSGTSVYASPE